jgi:antitoxin component of RelBE/YafQ-DinJ toxin-antitoxin module
MRIRGVISKAIAVRVDGTVKRQTEERLAGLGLKMKAKMI